MNPPTRASCSSHRSRSRIPVPLHRQGYPRKPIRVKRLLAPTSSMAYRPRSLIPVPIIHPGIPRKPIRVKKYPAPIRVIDSVQEDSGQVTKDGKKAHEDEAGRPPLIDTLIGTQEIYCCAVCLGPISKSREPMATKCEHIFCKECLMTALSARRNCPTCQSPTHIHLSRTHQEELARLKRPANRLEGIEGLMSAAKMPEIEKYFSPHQSTLSPKSNIIPETKN